MTDEGTHLCRPSDAVSAYFLPLAIGLLIAACGGADASSSSGSADQLVAEGEQLYQPSCAQCHGPDLTGTETGPPLLHPYYLPDHHPDESFYAAVERGVAPHHWNFGPMPPQPVSADDTRAIVAYIRSVQREEGFLQ